MKAKNWSFKELDILRREYATTSAESLNKRLGRSAGAIEQKASKMGLKKKHHGIEWTPQMIKILKDFFPTMFNGALASWLRVSKRTLNRKAKELGLEKAADFREKREKDIQRMAGEAIRRKGDVRGTWFKKGIRNNPAGEFKKGHQESEETKAKRIATMKATIQRKKTLKRWGLA